MQKAQVYHSNVNKAKIRIHEKSQLNCGVKKVGHSPFEIGENVDLFEQIEVIEGFGRKDKFSKVKNYSKCPFFSCTSPFPFLFFLLFLLLSPLSPSPRFFLSVFIDQNFTNLHPIVTYRKHTYQKPFIPKLKHRNKHPRISIPIWLISLGIKGTITLNLKITVSQMLFL